MATVTAMPNVKIAGGSFLIEERKPEEVFTPEDFTEQHLLIARTAEEFAIKEIVPNVEKLEHKDFVLLRDLGCAYLQRNVAYRLLWQRATEEEISARIGQRRDDWRLCAVGVVLGFGCAQLPHEGASFGGRKTLLTERRKEVDHQCGVRRSFYCVPQSRRRKVPRLYCGTQVPGFFSRRRRAQDGDSRLIYLSPHP